MDSCDLVAWDLAFADLISHIYEQDDGLLIVGMIIFSVIVVTVTLLVMFAQFLLVLIYPIIYPSHLS